MKQYTKLVKKILKTGIYRKNRTKIDSLSIFGHQMKFCVKNKFPLLTTKKLNLRLIIHELLWFLSGSNNIEYLKKKNVHIWDKWADEQGNLGPIYGFQWRKWNNNIDQIDNVIQEIIKNPISRRLIVSSWNVGAIHQMSIPPCHVLFQFYVNVENNNISLQLYQRSADVFLGLPFNIASYSLLLMMIAQVTGLKAYKFIHTLGDAHIYTNHIPQIKTQIKRKIKSLPEMVINKKIKNIEDFKIHDFVIKNYNPHPTIKGEIAI